MEKESIQDKIKSLNRRASIEYVRQAMLEYAKQVLSESESFDTMEIATVTVDKIIKELEWKP